MPGDGIGVPVMDAAIRVFDAAWFDAEYVHADIGRECRCKDGQPLPQRTVDLLAEHKIGLLWAVTSKPIDDAQAELGAHLQWQWLVYSSPIVWLRKHFDLDVSVRPCRSLPWNPLNFIRRDARGGVDEPVVDAVIFRQNTEWLYSGVERSNPPQDVYDAFNTHPRFSSFARYPKEEISISTRIFSHSATMRILEAAFSYADTYGYTSVTLCEKPNVIRETSGMMYKLAKKLQAEQYAHIELWNTNIDAQMMWLTKNPENYGVIVAGNMFGDIVSDWFAGLIGGLWFAASANVWAEVAVFEPTHGSAPKYAGYETSIVNPIAMVMSGVMMLRHISEDAIADRIEQACEMVVRDGTVQTYDMKRMRGAPDVTENGAASTAAMADAIIAQLW